jgi:O-antigen/teichoic acid export membrane protein
MFSLKGLTKDIVIYAIGNLAQRAVSFILLPFYTNTLSTSDYGLLETIFLTTQILAFALDVGISRSILRYYSRYQDDPQSLGKLFASGLVVTFAAEVIITGFSIAAKEQLSALFLGTSQYASIFIWVLASALVQSLSQLIFLLFRAKRQSWNYVVVSIAVLLALTILNIIFLRFWKLGIAGVLYAQVIVYFCVDLLLPPILKPYWKYFEFSPSMAKQLFDFGFPLIFASAGMLILNVFDRFFLLYYRGLVDVGIYTLSIRIAAILDLMVITPFQLAWAPFLFEKAHQDLGAIASRLLTYLLFFLAFGGITILLFSKELILLLATPDYLIAQGIVPFTLISMFLMGIFYWAGGLVNFVEQTWKLGVVVFLATMCNIGFNAFLTPRWGWWGAAWADMLARLIMAGITFIVAIRQIPIKFEYKRIISIGSTIAGILCLSYFTSFNTLNGVAEIGIKIMAMGIGMAALIGPLQFITQQERRTIQGIVDIIKHRVIK